MKKIFTALAAVAISASAFAQITGSLNPAGGKIYSGDFKHGGSIGITYSEAVGHTQVTDSSYVAVPPVATITVNNHTIVLNAYEKGNTGLYWGVAIQDTVNKVLPKLNQFYTMNVSVTGTAPGKTVQTLTGSYEYCPVFPFTGATPAANDTLTSKTQTVVFNFNQPVTYTGVTITSGDVVTPLAGGSSSNNQVSVPLSESYWGTTTGAINYINVKLTGVTLGNGVEISNVSNEDASIAVGYAFAEAIDVPTLLGVDPTPEEATYQEVYDGYWYATFKYNNEVQLPTTGTCAIVTFFDADDLDLDAVQLTSDDVYGDWNYRAGYYGIQVAVPAVPETAADYSYAEVALVGVSYNNTVLANQPSVIYQATLPSVTQFKRAPQSAGVENIGIELANDPFDVYSIQGAVVLRNATSADISNLERGIYIVNGKKVVIR